MGRARVLRPLRYLETMPLQKRPLSTPSKTPPTRGSKAPKGAADDLSFAPFDANRIKKLKFSCVKAHDMPITPSDMPPQDASVMSLKELGWPAPGSKQCDEYQRAHDDMYVGLLYTGDTEPRCLVDSCVCACAIGTLTRRGKDLTLLHVGAQGAGVVWPQGLRQWGHFGVSKSGEREETIDIAHGKKQWKVEQPYVEKWAIVDKSILGSHRKFVTLKDAHKLISGSPNPFATFCLYKMLMHLQVETCVQNTELPCAHLFSKQRYNQRTNVASFLMYTALGFTKCGADTVYLSWTRTDDTCGVWAHVLHRMEQGKLVTTRTSFSRKEAVTPRRMAGIPTQLVVRCCNHSDQQDLVDELSVIKCENGFVRVVLSGNDLTNMQECTHLVVNVDGTTVRLSSMLCLAMCIPTVNLVTKEWVKKCISAKAIAPVDDYILSGDFTSPLGMKFNFSESRVRARKGSVFAGYDFYVGKTREPRSGEKAAQPLRCDVLMIIKEAGGTVYDHPTGPDPSKQLLFSVSDGRRRVMDIRDFFCCIMNQMALQEHEVVQCVEVPEEEEEEEELMDEDVRVWVR